MKLEKKMQRYKKILYVALTVDLIILAGLSYVYLQKRIPDRIYVVENRQERFDFSLPIEANMSEADVEVDCNSSEKVKENIVFSFEEPFSLLSQKKGSYDISLKLFGIVPIKSMQVRVIEEKYLMTGGDTIGIEVNTNGIMVLGTGKVTGIDGNEYEPAKNIINSGDYIRKINKTEVRTKEDMIEKLSSLKEDKVVLLLERKGKEIEVALRAIQTKKNEYKLGIWVRDDTQGIGTLTYITENGEYGALGHGINDVDTGLLMEVEKGSIYEAGVYRIIKGKKGTPGEIAGYIKKDKASLLGTITDNSLHGIKGEYWGNKKRTKFPVGLKQEVKEGKATILCQISNQIGEYDIEIEKINLNSQNNSKGMIIRITDEELLKETNGIVQGMSGSPIMQNGKIIGAITHVFVQDPQRGYGTFIEYMLE